MFIDDMNSKGPMRITDVEDAQKSIMRIARKLADAVSWYLLVKVMIMSNLNFDSNKKKNGKIFIPTKIKLFLS